MRLPEVSGKNFWCKKGLVGGFRGLGNSFDEGHMVDTRENCLTSLKSASTSCDFVHVDVSISRDYVPIIYSNFELKINDNLSTTNKYSYDALKEASNAGRIQHAYKTKSKIDESTSWELPNLTSLFYDLDTVSLCLN